MWTYAQNQKYFLYNITISFSVDSYTFILFCMFFCSLFFTFLCYSSTLYHKYNFTSIDNYYIYDKKTEFFLFLRTLFFLIVLFCIDPVLCFLYQKCCCTVECRNYVSIHSMVMFCLLFCSSFHLHQCSLFLL